MDWISGILALLLIGELGFFVYMLYICWKEISDALKDAERLKEPIENLIDEGRGLQYLVQSFSQKVESMMQDVQEVIEIGRDTSAQVTTLVAAVGTFNSPNVKLAIRYGRDWIEERRMNPFVRKYKRLTRNLRMKLWRLFYRLRQN